MRNKFVKLLITRPIYVALFIFIFPVIIWLLAYFRILQIASIKPADLLSYYAIAFGLIGSMTVYLCNQEKQKIANQRDSVPNIKIAISQYSFYLEGTIENLGEDEILGITLYDEDLVQLLPSGDRFDFQFVIDKDVRTDSKIINIRGYDGLEVNKLGFPTYIQLFVVDSLKRGWVLTFDKRGDESSPEYPLSSMEVVTL